MLTLRELRSQRIFDDGSSGREFASAINIIFAPSPASPTLLGESRRPFSLVSLIACVLGSLCLRMLIDVAIGAFSAAFISIACRLGLRTCSAATSESDGSVCCAEGEGEGESESQQVVVVVCDGAMSLSTTNKASNDADGSDGGGGGGGGMQECKQGSMPH